MRRARDYERDLKAAYKLGLMRGQVIAVMAAEVFVVRRYGECVRFLAEDGTPSQDACEALALQMEQRMRHDGVPVGILEQ